MAVPLLAAVADPGLVATLAADPIAAVHPAIRFLCYAFVVFLGGGIGVSELVSRYRDAPFRALVTQPATLYIVLNALASFAALAAVRQFHWLEPTEAAARAALTSENAVSVLIEQTLAAGLSAMALFRTSLFTMRVANADIGIGPAAFLQILLSAADRACDRTRAKPRAAAVQQIMTGISFEKASVALPTLCFGLMQNVSADEQSSFSASVAQIRNAPIDEVFKANSLGLALMNLVGEDVLLQAVNMLRADITAPPKTIVQSLPTLSLLRNVSFETSASQMIDMCLFLTNRGEDQKLSDFLESSLNKIRQLTVPERQKKFLLSGVLLSKFTEETLQIVLRSLPENAGPSAQPSSAGAGSTGTQDGGSLQGAGVLPGEAQQDAGAPQTDAQPAAAENGKVVQLDERRSDAAIAPDGPPKPPDQPTQNAAG